MRLHLTLLTGMVPGFYETRGLPLLLSVSFISAYQLYAWSTQAEIRQKSIGLYSIHFLAGPILPYFLFEVCL